MRFAVRVPISNRIASRAAIVEAAQRAEELGFYAVTAHDRLIFDGRWIACGARNAEGAGDDRDVYESIVALSYLAGQTRRIRLMISVVILPMREVISLAKQVATLDVLSEGRLILGVGVGSRPPRREARGDPPSDDRVATARSRSASKEFEALGVSGHRGQIADEYLQAMREIWTQPSASFSGRFAGFDAIQVFPKPLQSGGPPILVGGSSSAALRRAARYGNGWLPNLMRPAEYAKGLRQLEVLAAEERRPIRYRGLNFFTCVASSDAEAAAIVRPTLGGMFSDEDLNALNLVGSPEAVIRRLREYEAAGADFVELKPIARNIQELFAMLDVLARDVIPAFSN